MLQELGYVRQTQTGKCDAMEGWRADQFGNVVGANSRRPVLLLEDLMVALRAGESSNMTGISCSIDPTP